MSTQYIALILIGLTTAFFAGKPSDDELPPKPSVERVAPLPVDDSLREMILEYAADLDAHRSTTEAAIERHSVEIAKVEECHKADIAALTKRIEALESKSLTVAPALPAIQPAKRIVQSAPVQAAKQAVAKVADAVYQPRWNNFDGKDRMRHAIEDHGIDTSKYSQSQVLQMMDADHDRFGGNGHAAIRASRNIVSAPPVRVVQPRTVYSYPSLRGAIPLYSRGTLVAIPCGYRMDMSSQVGEWVTMRPTSTQRNSWAALTSFTPT